MSSVALLLLATPMMRPMIFAQILSIPGVVIGAIAALLAWRDDHRQSQPPRMHGPDKGILFCTAILWMWVLLLLGLRPATFGIPTGQALRGVISVVALLACALLVLREPERRRRYTRGLVLIVLISCALYCVTLAYWLAKGFGGGVWIQLPLGIQDGPTRVAFPFTPIFSTQTFDGLTIFRFQSIGGEAGIGGILIAWCFLMADRVGLGRARWKVILLIGIIGTLSTAGFAISIVAWVADRWLIHRGPVSGTSILKQWFGLGLAAVAVWLAIYAPFLGVSAKATRDSVSASDRTDAFAKGWYALGHYPIGRGLTPEDTPHVSTISIIASAVEIGAPGVLLSIAAFAGPVLASEAFGLAFAPVALILANCLTSQPTLQSTTYLILVSLACWQPSDPKPEDLAVRPSTLGGVAAVAARFPVE